MPPVYDQDGITVLHGDCLDVLAGLPDSSVDAVVTDPPYGLEFMGKDWDRFAGAVTDRDFKGFVLSQQRTRNVKCPDCQKWAYDHPGRLCECGGIRRAQGLTFQAWCEQWAAECLRVLKPGGHLLAFGGTRTYHRLTCAIEDAGFEIRDGITWLYGSGFPKSMDVSKAIDKRRDDRADINRVTCWLAEQRDRAGLTNRQIDEAFGFAGMAGHWTAAPQLKIAAVPRWEQWQKLRDLIGFDDAMDAEVWRLNGRKGTPGEAWEQREVIQERTKTQGGGTSLQIRMGEVREVRADITAPATDAARKWSGFGTALKPAHEPIVMARKPLSGTVAANVTAHGTGALNIDGCRVETYSAGPGSTPLSSVDGRRNSMAGPMERTEYDSAKGRWPANVVFTHSPDCADECAPGCPVAELDAQSGALISGSGNTRRKAHRTDAMAGTLGHLGREEVSYGDTGGASRFFPAFRYQAKAATRERPKVNGVAHPTVKPLALMRWLVRLVTPPGGVVLDPFLGSGTTAQAARDEGFRCIGIERDAEYLDLIRQRLGTGGAA